MKIFDFKIAAVFLLLLASSCEKGGSTATAEIPPVLTPPGTTAVRVFERNDHGFALFRIPAFVKTNKKTLLVFAEARKLASNGDGGDIDLVLRRSTDGGKTWGSMITIWNDGTNTCGNPVPVIDEETGDIHLLTTWNNQRVFATKSTDDGLTWAAPREITSSVKPAGWGFYATGPVHGIQISKGLYKGRLVVPAYATAIINGVRKNHSFMIYSNDKGQSWIMGDVTKQENVGECTVVELNDGRLMLNLRSDLPYRSVAFSDNGGLSWSESRYEANLTDPRCQASLLSFKKGNENTLFFSNPASLERENMTIRISTDEGLTWPKRYQVFAGPSAYSDMVMMDDTTVGIVFESGINSPHGHILFNTVAIANFK